MEHGFVAIPATPVAVSLYLIHLVETSASASPISAALSAIKWAHQKACVQLPVNAMVEQIAAAAKRRLACTPRRKEPLNKKQVATIVGQLAGSDDCLKLRTAVTSVCHWICWLHEVGRFGENPGAGHCIPSRLHGGSFG
eukprot:scpid89763/ scgid32485/ 